jgi:hypothetical protein
VIDTVMLAQFHNVDPEAMGTYEEEQATVDYSESKERDTDLGNRTNTQAGDVSTRSARSSILTNNEADMSPGSIQLNELVDGDALQEEDEDVNVQIGEDSYVGEGRIGGRIRAIDLWELARTLARVGARIDT